MADKTEFLQAIDDAILDADSLERFINGDDTQDVLTRLSKRYPTLQKAIKTLFENGGLPASPFATKALMLASTLVNGEYALVTDDSVADNNGVYIKTAGAWIKSSYDPVAQAKREAVILTDDAKSQAIKASELYSNLLVSSESKEIVPIKYDEGNYYYDLAGVKKTSALSKTTTPISVKKGECYVLSGSYGNQINGSAINMVNSDGSFIKSLVSNGVDTTAKDATNKLLLKEGIYNHEESAYNYGVVIPSDGFISVTITDLVPVPDGLVIESPLLYRTNFDGLINATQVQADKDALIAFKGILHTAPIDKAVHIAGNGGFSFSNVGSVVAYLRTSVGSVSEKIAVKKGEYIHIHNHRTATTKHNLIFEDAEGITLGVADTVSNYTASATGAGNASFNILSPFTGFFRVVTKRVSAVPFLVGVTSNPVNYTKSYLGSNEDIKFFPNTTYSGVRGVSSVLNKATMASLSNLTTQTNANYTCSLPYLLKKGEVVEYELAAASSPAFMVAYRVGGETTLSPENVEGVVINANEVISMEQGQAWITAGKPTDNRFFADASSGKVAYCSEETDTVIIFLRPTSMSTQFALYKQSEKYSVLVHTKEDYIKKRDSEIADRFTKFSKYVAHTPYDELKLDAFTDSVGSYPSVLMFKGEVLSYLTNHRGGAAAANLNIFKTNNSSILYLDGSMWSHSLSEDYQNLPISLSNPLSHWFAQVYCQETSVVTVGVTPLASDRVTGLDTERLIQDKYYPARVLNIKDIIIGRNIKPMVLSGVFAGHQKREDGSVYFRLSKISNMDAAISYAPKGTYVEFSHYSQSSSQTPTVFKLDKVKFESLSFKAVAPLPEDEDYKLQSGDFGQYETGTYLEDDSLVIVGSLAVSRAGVDYPVRPVDEAFPAMVGTYEHNIKTISSGDYVNKYKVTSENRISIGNTKGIKFNFCTISGSSLLEDVWSKVQLIVDNEIVAVLNVLTANQGQSSANFTRQNVNMEFYNDKFEKVYIKFGDHIEEAEVVLKSYQNTDRGHFKDIGACNLWHSISNAKPYPEGGALPSYIVDDPSKPKNKLARGTTFGFPVELYRGGKFASLATLRNKKKRENYAMEKNNKNHILMQANGNVLGKPSFTWSVASLDHFEIRNPSMSGYEDFDTELPVGFESVQASGERILNWMTDVYLGNVDFESTYEEYIDLNSFINYTMTVILVGSLDSQINNFLLGTHDGKIWRIFWYDSDRSWGVGLAGNPLSASWTLSSSSSFMSRIPNLMPDEFKASYHYMRKMGVISIRSLQGHIRELSDSIHSDSMSKDIEYWGELNEVMTLPTTLKWIYNRVRFLDTLYDYLDVSEGIIAQRKADLPAVNASTSKQVTLTGTIAKVGDKLKVFSDNSNDAVSITAECLVEGTVVVTFSTKSVETIGGYGYFLQVEKV